LLVKEGVILEPSKVYFIQLKTSDQKNLNKKKIKRLFNNSGLSDIIDKFDLTAVKMHFGEQGNITFLPPEYIEPVVRMIKSQGAKPFLCDSNVLYKSERDNAVDHLLLANRHGFTLENTGAPIVIADGIAGNNEIEITIDAPINKKVALASEFITANSIIVVSHATGHLGVGLGASIKNLGMGMASRKGKLIQHSVSKPEINQEKCTACGICKKWCPEDCIAMYPEYAEINEDKCIGCGECLAVCRFSAVNFKWDSSSEELQKQIAEHALGIVKQKKRKIGYLLFLVNMTKDCDCIGIEQEKIIDDIGVLAGNDPVALDQAALDLTKKYAGKNLQEKSFPDIDCRVQLEYAENIGVGTRKYVLEEVEI